MMTWNEYLDTFDPIISGEISSPPYDKEAYIEYTRLNKARMNRWLKTGKLIDSAEETMSMIDRPQQWFLITEAWCGDAAHSNPFIQLLSELNDNITLNIILRDSEPNWINNYLTDGNRSIPKLIVRDESGDDVFTWGPRPIDCQRLVLKMKSEQIEVSEAKMITQQWYNNDKGQSVQQEILEQIRNYFGTRS